MYAHEDLLSSIDENISRVPTPSYAKAVSEFLTNYIVWLLNTLEHYKHMFYNIIYLGGDDIFIISDVSSALEISSMVVTGFSKTHEKMSVDKSTKVTRILPGWSMSLSVVWTHYKHPLRDAIRVAFNDLEKAKEAEWKDVLEMYKITEPNIMLIPSKEKCATSLNLILSTFLTIIKEGITMFP